MKYDVFDAHVDTLMLLKSPEEYLEGNSVTQLNTREIAGETYFLTIEMEIG
jgi:hypothetical protein